MGYGQNVGETDCLLFGGISGQAAIDTHSQEQHHRSMRFYPAFLLATLAGLSAIGCSQLPETYAANCSMPLKNWGREKDGIAHLRPVQPIYLASDGLLLWDEEVISDATLQRHMAQVSALNPEPHVILEVAPAAACRRVEAIRAIMDEAPLCKGQKPLCSEGWNWRRWPIKGGS